MRLTHYDELKKRWQINDDYDAVAIDDLNYAVGEAIDKLAAYEDAEEQGRLMILPCKVGDALFVTNEGTCLPAVRMVELVAWYNGKVFIRAVNNRTGIEYYCSAEDFGKTVFLTREEAKAAMKGERAADV